MSRYRRRFSGRVSHTVRHRPGYPEALLDRLVGEAGLDPRCAVADVGSGSGIFTRVLLPRVGRVYAVEPNAEMRAYESLLCAESLDYERVDHRHATRRLDGFFTERQHWTFDHQRDLDWEASLGYMLSASYVPPAGHPSHARIVEGLGRIFRAHERGGRVAWVYRAELFLGIV